MSTMSNIGLDALDEICLTPPYPSSGNEPGTEALLRLQGGRRQAHTGRVLWAFEIVQIGQHGQMQHVEPTSFFLVGTRGSKELERA